MSYIGKTPTPVPLTSSDITDSIISLPKLTDGTDGNLISYDASGNPVAVATGTDGQVLTSTGAGSPPAFEALPAGGTNTPAFSVYKNANFDISDAVVTKVPFDTEIYDTDNAFASNKFTVPSGQDGKYCFYAKAMFIKAGVSQFNIQFQKNGTKVAERYVYSGAVATTIWTSSYFSFDVSCSLTLSAGDYVEVFVMVDSTDGGDITVNGGQVPNGFTGFKIIE
jgi:hypothetical protein